MKNSTKALAACVAVMLSCAVWADSAVVDGITWEYKRIYGGTKAEIVSSTPGNAAIPKNTEGAITVPEKLDGYEVKIIGENAFAGCDKLTSVTLPRFLNDIEDDAFKDCTSLERVEFSSATPIMRRTDSYVTNIKSACFSGCPEDMLLAYTAQPWQFRLVDDGVELWYNSDTGEPTIDAATSGHIDIPSTQGGLLVVSIGEEAFYGCDKLTSVTIPETVTRIGEEAFSGCDKLTSVSIPDSVTSIGDEAFWGCDAMADAEGRVIVRDVLHYYVGAATQVTIPDGVTRIGSAAFRNRTALESVIFPASLTSIGNMAFWGCVKLANAPIPDGVTSIGEEAFWGCEAMADANGFVIVRDVLHYYDDDGVTTKVTIPGNVTHIGRRAFWNNTTFIGVNLPVSVTSIGAEAFVAASKLEVITIPAGVTKIGRRAFNGTSLNMVHVENGCTDTVRNLIENMARYDTSGVTFNEDLPTSVEVRFDARGGSVSPKKRRVLSGAAVGPLPEPTYEGYVFAGWFTASEGGEQVTAETIVTESVTYFRAHWTKLPDPVPANFWFTTRAEALAEAKKTGKTVFMICGRDTCSNTMMTKNVSCEDPKVRDLLTAKCVLWYSNCDTQMDENYRYWGGLGSGITLPIICAIDPNDPEHSIFCIAGPQTADGILLLLQWIPEPSTSSVVDPESLDPFYPGEMTGYKVLNPADIWDPIRAPKAVTLMGAAYYGNDVVGIVELKVGKLNKNQQAKVSGSVTMLDGTKYTIKSKKFGFGGTLATTISLDVKGGGSLDIAIGSIGGVNKFSGKLGKWHVQTANVGTGWSKATATVTVDVANLASLPEGMQTSLLPTNEVATASGGKWTFKKAAKVKWMKAMQGLAVDTSGGKTNLSGMKLTYTPKKGTFNGSFKVYEVKGSKLKNYKVNVMGVVVDGVGYGQAICKKPSFTWSVLVK